MKIFKKYLAVSATFFFIIGCANEPEYSINTFEPKYEKTEIIERLGNVKETPSWANGSKVLWREKNEVIFVSTLQFDGNTRPESCMKAASLDGKANILSFIEENITSSGQLSELDASTDPAFESLTAFISQGKISGVSVKERYWEKIVTSTTDGQRSLKLNCASKIAIKESDLRRQLAKATRSNPEGNKEIRDALIDAQVSFLNELPAE